MTVTDVATGLRTIFDPARASAQTYVEKNMLGMLGLIVLIAALPEIPLHHVLLPRNDWWIAILLDALVLYTAAWIFGLYGIMACSPHVLDGERLIFHRGPLGRAEVERASIAQATPIENPDSRAIRRAKPDAYFGLPGSDLVHLRLNAPARIVRTFPVLRETRTEELYIASDRPRELCALLHDFG